MVGYPQTCPLPLGMNLTPFLPNPLVISALGTNEQSWHVSRNEIPAAGNPAPVNPSVS